MRKSTDTIWTALPISLSIVIMFLLLQKSGILNIGIDGNITPLTSFIIGLVASVSSCLAVVGGLVLSLSAKVSQDDVTDTKTFFMFHIARVVTFAILGGALGAVGGVLRINFTFSSMLGIIAAVVMIILGLNLVGFLKHSKIILPKSIFRFFNNLQFNRFTPLILGFGTFFLPCGFTQSMQVSALSSGSFLSGLLIMLTFSLGTLPVLAFLSFGSTPLSRNKHSDLFFKSAGFVVIFLGLFSLLSGLASLEIISPILSI